MGFVGLLFWFQLILIKRRIADVQKICVSAFFLRDSMLLRYVVVVCTVREAQSKCVSYLGVRFLTVNAGTKTRVSSSTRA